MAVLTVAGKSLALGDLLQEVGLTSFDVGREALGLGFLNGQADGLALANRLLLGLLLLGTMLSAIVAAEIATEVGVDAALVVEVDGVG